ncbi:MAG: phytanoyl-CoA dioxygenase family protein [Candidatus Phaeomarinobacter sp.]
MSGQVVSAGSYGRRDHAGTHKATYSTAVDKVDPKDLEHDLEALKRDGFVIIESLLGDAEIAAIKAGLIEKLDHKGRNDFEGHLTQRLYAVPEKTRIADQLIEHPRVLALLDSYLMPGYLLSQCQVINILPKETSQALHTDDGFYPIPRPRAALSAAVVWAIDPFTEDNGATVVVPNSQDWAQGRQPGPGDRTVKAIMPEGSVVFYPGTLWHGGGANMSDASRLGVTCQYCEPWLRTQENYFLSLSKETVRDLSEDMKRMMGYSIYPPFIGMVDGMHPKRTLED